MFVDKRLIAKIHIYPTDFRLNRKRQFSRYYRNQRIVHRKQKEEYVENAIPPCYKSTQSILQNEHGVAKAEEAVALLDGGGIGIHDLVAGGKRAFNADSYASKTMS